MLVAYVKQLDICREDRKSAYRAIAQFTARIITTAREINETAWAVSTETRRKLNAFRNWTDSSDYWGELWRVMVKVRNPLKYDVDPADAAWIYRYLKRKDVVVLERIQGFGLIPTKRFGPRRMNRLLRELTRHCRYVAHRKLSFISKYDPGLSLEDMISDMVEVGLKTIRRNENWGNPLLAINHAKRAAYNRAINIIKAHTTQKRARLINTGNGEREYSSVLTSLTNLGIVERHTPIDDLIERISIRLGPNHEHYARCVLGTMPHFDEWVKEWVGREPKNISPPELGILARSWVGLTQTDLEENLAGLLE